MQDENEQKERYDLKKNILNNQSIAMMSEYKIKEELRKYFQRYNSVPREKRFNEYEISKIKDVYNLFKRNGIII